MCSASPKRLTPCLLLIAVLIASAANAQERVLRVCTDPNNLPFSNAAGQGFENRIAEMLAREMGAKLEYSWRAQRRGFYRESLKNGHADIAMSAPVILDHVLTTKAYYSSCYYFVTRKDSNLHIKSLDDPQLKHVRIGIQLMMGDVSPPVQALILRGITQNIRGFSVTADYSKPNPPAEIVKAVAERDVDVAIVWGPLAGYFAKQQAVPLELTRIPADPKLAGMPFSFDIGIAVAKDNPRLRDEINVILERNQDEVAKILDEYHIPRVAISGQGEEKKTASAEENCPCP